MYQEVMAGISQIITILAENMTDKQREAAEASRGQVDRCPARGVC